MTIADAIAQFQTAAADRRRQFLKSGRRFPFLTALCAGLTVGVGYPLVDLALACRLPVSEACVWGKAYLPLTLGVSVVVLGGSATGLLYAVLKRRRPSRDESA